MFSEQSYPPFSVLLRHARIAAGLTQAQLAERAGLSERGISNLERSIIQIPRSYTIGRLAEALGLSPAERAQFLAAAMHEAPAMHQTAPPEELDPFDGGQGTTPVLEIVRQAPRMSTMLSPPQHLRLPVETTRFIGRTHALHVITHLLASSHLLTLVGPPGTGKTRLALHLARQVAETFRDGAYLVSLAPVSDPALVPQAIARTLRVSEAAGQPLLATLQQVLRDKHLLLLLDNCEHLLPAAAHVAELIAAAPHLKVLATSREPLHLYGEQEYAVPPLALPNLGNMDDLAHPARLEPQILAECESIALFVQQARAVRPEFALTTENARDVAEICVRLDGLPLAIELAAARSKMLSPNTLLTRLSHRLDTLTRGARNLPARQQTLANTIAWSFNLLSTGEQTLFARLAVFRGGCSLDAIEAVCGDGLPMDVFDGLTSLVDKSLIQQEELPNHEARFRMLETLQEYAWEQLQACGEVQALQLRHAAYFVQLAEQAEPELRQAQQWDWFRRLETEYANLRAVLTWSLQGNGDEGNAAGVGESAQSAQSTPTGLGVRLAGALCHFWFSCGYHAEGRAWAQLLLDHLGAMPSVPIQYHAKLLLTAGHMTWKYDLDAAQHYYDQALEFARALGDPVTLAWALVFQGNAMLHETGAALAVAEEGLALFRKLHHHPGIAQALCILGSLAYLHGDDARARQAYEACLAVSQTTGETRRIRKVFKNLAMVSRRAGEYERARALAEQSLQMALETNSKLGITEGLSELAAVLEMTGQSERAARLLGAREAALARMGAACDPIEMLEYDRVLAAIRAQLSPEAFAAVWNEGRVLSLEQAVALALECRDLSTLRE